MGNCQFPETHTHIPAGLLNWRVQACVFERGPLSSEVLWRGSANYRKQGHGQTTH